MSRASSRAPASRCASTPGTSSSAAPTRSHWQLNYPAASPTSASKDVSLGVAERFRRGELSYRAAVRAGLCRSLGQADVDVAGVIQHLEADGYSGWYVLEHDTILEDDPQGEGPVGDVRISAEFVRNQLEIKN